jgi:hypothetical protein
MLRKMSFLLLSFLIACNTLSAQTADLEEKKPATFDGIEYGYIIKNEQTKSAKGEEYGRFEITLYITNKSGCTRLFGEGSAAISKDAANLLATFYCTNANGKRLTSKSVSVKARDFNVAVKVKEGDKEFNRQVKAGYIFRNGETIRSSMIVLVPLNEKPIINCSLNALPELQ